MAIELALMASDTKKAIKSSPKHLLGIQDLKVSEIKHILNEAQQFIDLNRSKNKKSDILKKLKKRKNFNKKLFNKFQKIQFSSQYKIRKSDFIIKNDFTKKTINTNIKNILQKIKQ